MIFTFMPLIFLLQTVVEYFIYQFFLTNKFSYKRTRTCMFKLVEVLHLQTRFPTYLSCISHNTGNKINWRWVKYTTISYWANWVANFIVWDKSHQIFLPRCRKSWKLLYCFSIWIVLINVIIQVSLHCLTCFNFFFNLRKKC